MTNAVDQTGLSRGTVLNRLDWTSGFLDERLVEPVSPLGWSVLRAGLEEVAFREPLRLIGVDPAELEPITRLWRGHPYVNVAVFEALYKLFPDWLLPDDARRYFPGGETARRKRARRPRSLWSPDVWLGLARGFLADPLAVSPLHNDSAWRRFEPRYVRAVARLSERTDALERGATRRLGDALALIDAVEVKNRRLLELHRWSLTLAEVTYSLLRRVATRMLGRERAAAYCSEVVNRLEDRSVELNRGLRELGHATRAGDEAEYRRRLALFLAVNGHRSFSLDLIRPNFAVDPTQILPLIRTEPPQSLRRPPIDGARRRVLVERALGPLAGLARRYASLREDERFTWQRGLALLRRLYLIAGESLVTQGALAQADDVFFLTADEVRNAGAADSTQLLALARFRARSYAEDLNYFDRDPHGSYPPFLRGDEPWEVGEGDHPGTTAPAAPPDPGAWQGVPVSPGIGRGRARVVLRPDELAQLTSGEILVVRGADPGWTVVFDRVAALVAESGGQLSHAAVVARECQLPAVVAVTGATSLIHTGDELVVDGSTGVIQRVG
jgi:phosphohistidine swiveling domain-containing protein